MSDVQKLVELLEAAETYEQYLHQDAVDAYNLYVLKTDAQAAQQEVIDRIRQQIQEAELEQER